MTPYGKVFKVFLKKIKDPVFVELAYDIAEEELIYLLNEAIIDFEYPKIDLSDKDDEIQTFAVGLSYSEISILSDLMVLNWAKSMLRDIDNLSYDMTPEEMRTTSKANHINSLMRYEQKLEKDVERKKNKYSRRDRNQPLFDSLGGVNNDD